MALPKNKRARSFSSFNLPTDRHRDAYITSIRDRSEEDIRLLLRHFLLESGNLGDLIEYYTRRKDFKTLSESSEFVRRLAAYESKAPNLGGHDLDHRSALSECRGAPE